MLKVDCTSLHNVTNALVQKTLSTSLHGKYLFETAHIINLEKLKIDFKW